MKITKLGHCCLVVEPKAGVRIMTDPGSYTVEEQLKEKNIDLILITHEHSDHCHIDSLKKIVAQNPAARIITNTAVSEILKSKNIKFEILEDGGIIHFKNIPIEGCGKIHDLAYPGIPQLMNTGYLIDNYFFYPGDALYDPKREIKVLATPLLGSWVCFRNAIDYVKKVNPRSAFGVHDGYLKEGVKWFHEAPQRILKESGIDFRILKPGEGEKF